MGEHVAITVADAPSCSDDPVMPSVYYVLLILRSLIICISAAFNVYFEIEHAFENNKAFSNICLYASMWVAITYVVMLRSLPIKEENATYNLLKLSGSFAASLAPFSFLMVIFIPPKLNWIGYLLVCVMFEITVVCFQLYDLQQDNKPSTCNDVALASIPLLAFLIIFFPKSCSIYMTYVTLGLETAYHCITYSTFFYKKVRNPEACAMFIRERRKRNAYRRTQEDVEDEDNDKLPPICHLSYMMPIGRPSY
ncbi:hypothetical protein QVD17_39237 [Tagetes erecta]|uniref:Uncharacterized protein n=1 Tax=Tagetes erecta TaxID=13708 RepID=A0AAD8JN74_TARER|nr:hypothetical protein QVD17_39237 [Tagetes erecta]